MVDLLLGLDPKIIAILQPAATVVLAAASQLLALARDADARQFEMPSEREMDLQYTIMIVEDELLLRLDLANQLHSAGFEVIEAQCADEALKILATDIDVDLILTDIRMPGQIDGLGLVSSVQQQDRDIKLVLLSAYVNAESKSPADASFAKPVRIGALLAKVRQLLNPAQTPI
jgi:CheY-like chemotaxis protein